MAPANKRPIVSIPVLGLLGGLGPLSTHIIVPVLPMIADDLHVHAAEVQIVLSLYLVGLAGGQLFLGALSDSMGRRPILLFGLLIYSVSTGAAILASDLLQLCAARFIQGCGASAGVVLARAMARDGFGALDTSRRLAILSVVVSSMPVASPLVGLLIAHLGGWRANFLFLCGLSACLLAYTISRVAETNPCGDAKQGHYPKAKRIVFFGRISGEFLGFSIAGIATTASMYAIVGAWTGMFVETLQWSATIAGVFYGLLMLSHAAGAISAQHLSVATTLLQVARRTNGLAIVSAFMLLLVTFFGLVSTLTILVPSVLFAFSAGLINPFTLSKALSADEQRVGTASAVYGCGQMLFGALCAALPSRLLISPAAGAALVTLISALCGQLALARVGRSDSACP
ncbi:MFS transporter [Bradyrhizobium sp. UFLA05-109]